MADICFPLNNMLYICENDGVGLVTLHFHQGYCLLDRQALLSFSIPHPVNKYPLVGGSETQILEVTPERLHF